MVLVSVSSVFAQVAVSTWGFNMDLINEHITDTFVEQFDTEILYDLGNNADRLTRLQLRSDNPEISVVELAPTFAIRAMREGLIAHYGDKSCKQVSRLILAGAEPAKMAARRVSRPRLK